jgi:TetR/AcrR family transcriptional repressor of nem operon
MVSIMALAGMTHGGFYRHFGSKEELVAATWAASMEALLDMAEDITEGGDEGFLQHIEEFLSIEPRDTRLGASSLVVFGSELARADKDTRRTASQGFLRLINIVAGPTNQSKESPARDIYALLNDRRPDNGSNRR